MSLVSAIAESISFLEALDEEADEANQAAQLCQLIARAPCNKLDITNALQLLKGKRGREVFSKSSLTMLEQSLAKIGTEIQIFAGGQSNKILRYSQGQGHEFFCWFACGES